MKRLAALGLTCILAAVGASANDWSSLYDSARLAREKPRLDTRANEMFNLAIRRLLTSDESARTAAVTVDVPLIGVHHEPLEFYSRGHVITAPVLSMLFLEDLCTAYAWLYFNGYRLETIEEYVSMLKYRGADAFGGRYPPPLAALRIPGNALADRRVDDLARRLRNEALGFILAHELAHLYYRHPGNGREVPRATSVRNEQQADNFAMEILRRSAGIPLGALLFFQATAYFSPNRGDARSDSEWQTFLTRENDHPLTPDRLEAMAGFLDRNATDFARLDAGKPGAVETVRFVAGGFTKLAAFLKNPDLQKVMAAKAARSDPSSLFPRRTNTTVL